MTRNQIKKEFIRVLRSGRLIDLDRKDQIEVFNGAMDRYTDIIHAFQDRHRVLDVGCAGGVMLSMLSELGHECHGVDIIDRAPEFPTIYKDKKIPFSVSNAEVDSLPYPENYFDAVACSQCVEHFTHSPRHALQEFRRVLKPGGLVEIDVPNVACFRNRSRLLRGKNITWDFESAYFDVEPIQQGNMSFFPMRHNREYTKAELEVLLQRSNFTEVDVRYNKSRHYRTGWECIRSIGSAARDLIPSFRKSLIGFGIK